MSWPQNFPYDRYENKFVAARQGNIPPSHLAAAIRLVLALAAFTAGVWMLWLTYPLAAVFVAGCFGIGCVTAALERAGG